ncbi:hypothetical protein AURDEDRAFT_116491 [Auricularia subglabra TFB-10046 SS5]|nr:hypothetical protein AURDEDRAFT_116491 [Auricularia subglabra TFB-10046 SS5]
MSPPPAVAFEALLAHPAKGNALWGPRANSGSVGDCGYFMDGSFIKLFSVFGAPLGLPMLQLDSGDVQRHNLPNTSVLQSSSKSKIMLARGVPVGPPPHTVTGSFELAPEEPACAFLAFGGHSRVVDSGPAKKLALYLAENQRKIYECFRAGAPRLEEDDIVILHETTKAGAWLGGVAYTEGAVSGTFTLDGEGAKVTLPRPRDPSALKNPARVRWEFTYGRSEGPTPTCCVVAKAIVARKRPPSGATSSRSSTRSRSSTWSVASPHSGSGWGSRSSTLSSSSRSRSSTWSKGSGSSSGRRLSVRALAEWNRMHPRTPMTEDDLEIRSPVTPEDASWHRPPPPAAENEPEPAEGDDRSLLERILDNILREYPSIDVAVGDWSCISDYEERHSKTPSSDIVPAFKALHTWLTPDGVNAAYLSHIPAQATSFQFIDLRAYTSGMRPTTSMSTSSHDSRPLPMSRTASSTSLTASPQRRPLPRKPSIESGLRSGASSIASSRRPSDASIGPGHAVPVHSHSRAASVHSHVGAPVHTDAGRRLRAGSVLVAMSLPSGARPAPSPLMVRNP